MMKHAPYKKQVFTLIQICFIRNNAELYTPEEMSIKIEIEPDRIRNFMHRNGIRIKPAEEKPIRIKNAQRSSVSRRRSYVPESTESTTKIDRAAFTKYSNRQWI